MSTSELTDDQAIWDSFLSQSSRELLECHFHVQEALLTVNGIGSDDLYSFNLYKSKLLLLRERIKNLQEVRELYENIENFETYDEYSDDEEESEEERPEEEFEDPRKFSKNEKVNLQISVYQNCFAFKSTSRRMQESRKTKPPIENRSGWGRIRFEVLKEPNLQVKGENKFTKGKNSLNILSITPMTDSPLTKYRSPLLHGFLHIYSNRSSDVKGGLNIPFFHSKHSIKMLEREIYDGYFVDYNESIEPDETSSRRNSLNIDFCVQQKISDAKISSVFLKEVDRVKTEIAKVICLMNEILNPTAPHISEEERARQEGERILERNRQDALEVQARREEEERRRMEPRVKVEVEQPRVRDPRRRPNQINHQKENPVQEERIHYPDHSNSHIPSRVEFQQAQAHIPPELRGENALPSYSPFRPQPEEKNSADVKVEREWPDNPRMSSRKRHRDESQGVDRESNTQRQNPAEQRTSDDRMTPAERKAYYEELLQKYKN